MLDYTTREKKFLSVKLIDGQMVFIGVPKKQLFSRLTHLEENLKNTEEIEPLYDEVLQLTAEILSNNKSGTKFTAEAVDEIMDFEDMALLIREYSAYAGAIVKNPN
jgi:hypothetical protein|nr:MAG TPA_asm: hypothetical protein [Caudoviricetes sp.]